MFKRRPTAQKALYLKQANVRANVFLVYNQLSMTPWTLVGE
jgi:hypothetical protein